MKSLSALTFLIMAFPIGINSAQAAVPTGIECRKAEEHHPESFIHLRLNYFNEGPSGVIEDAWRKPLVRENFRQRFFVSPGGGVGGSAGCLVHTEDQDTFFHCETYSETNERLTLTSRRIHGEQQGFFWDPRVADFRSYRPGERPFDTLEITIQKGSVTRLFQFDTVGHCQTLN